MRTVEKEVKKIEKFYIAVDGKEFSTEADCRRYEARLEKQKEQEKVLDFLKRFEIKKISGRFPLNYDGIFSDTCEYTWVRIPDEETLDELDNLTDHSISTKYIQTPTIMCFESDDENNLLKPDYCYTFESCVNSAKQFFKDLGYKIEITKEA